MVFFARSSVLAAMLALLTSAPARAQYVPPRVEVSRLPSAGVYPSLEPKNVVVGDCLALTNRLKAARLEELASIRVTAYTQWYVSAERLARDKAGEVGANCLVKKRAWGVGSYPFSVSYEAYRLSREVGFGSLGYRLPLRRAELDAAIRPADLAVASPGAAASSPPATSDTADVPLWTSGNFIFRYEIGMDTAKFPDAVWQDVNQDFKEFFPPSQYSRLLRAHRRGARILVDFKNLRITEVR